MSSILDVPVYAGLMTGGNVREQFGNWLQERLDRRGWSASMLADAIGSPRGTVSRWLGGTRRITDDKVRLVARALGVDERVALYHAGYMGDDYPVELEISEQLDEALRRIDNVRDIGREIDRRIRRVEVWGRVPADTFRATQDEEIAPVEIAVSALKGARSPFGLLIVGDCMRSLGMFPGDVLICDRDVERKPKDGELVVVRLHEGVTFKRWCVVDDLRVELRDGDGNVAYTLNAVIDDYVIEGFYVTYEPLAPR